MKTFKTGKAGILLMIAMALFTTSCTRKTVTPDYPTMIAHRGCWLKGLVPENSVEAVRMAKRFGYTGIECDVHYTKDSVMVILHDKTLNRTARRAADYGKLEQPVKLSDLTFEELRRDYVLASSDPSLRTPVPTLTELLSACKENGITPMLHSSLPESYRVAQEMFGDEWICFHGSDSLHKLVRTFSNCLTLLDPGADKSAESAIERLNRIGGRAGISTMKKELLTQHYCQALRQAGYEVQASIFPCPHEAQATRNGVSILLTDFSLMPNSKFKPWDVWESEHTTMLPQEKIEKKWAESIDYGGLTLELDFKGTVEVRLNNENTYTLTREDYGQDCVGLRFHHSAPSFQIEAKDSTDLKYVKSNVYKF
ncbi:MAG: hypothetical protein IKC18_03390 [Bacteroidaceae bacterium]|nr:hypothetical protein [Bacteroidaceae bacterium]